MARNLSSMSCAFALAAASVLVMAMGSAAHARITTTPQSAKCEGEGGFWNRKYPPSNCAYSTGTEACGSCYKPNSSDCFAAGGTWHAPPVQNYLLGYCILRNRSIQTHYP